MYAKAALATGVVEGNVWTADMMSRRAVSMSGWACAPIRKRICFVLSTVRRRSLAAAAMHAAPDDEVQLELTQENVERVLIDARIELLQLFDTSVGITGVAELADLDGPFLKLRLRGRFWHQRSVVLSRLGNYLKKRIPEIVEVQIEDERQLDDSSANFGFS